MRRLRHGLALLLVLLPACLADVAGGPMNVCAGDADCTSGVCNVELGMCVTNARETLRIALEVRSDESPYGGPVRVPFSPMLVDGPDTQDLTLPATIPTSGLLRDYAGQPILADVTFGTESEIPGYGDFSVSAEVGEIRTQGEYSSNMTAQLLPGRAYGVEIEPTAEFRRELPPLRPVQQWMSPDGGIARIPDELLTYPRPCSTGDELDPANAEPCLVTIDGLIVDAGGEPQDGMVVRAIETATGDVISSTFVSGSDEGSAPGSFRSVMEIRYLADPESWFFRVTPSADRSERLGPSATFTVEPSSLLESAEGVSILTPSVAATVTYEGIVEAASDMRALANATLTFESRDVVDMTTGVIGLFSATATTDADGQFSVELLPGNYDVVVTPDRARPEDAVLAVLREERDLTEASGSARGQLFQVPDRVRFNGSVVTRDGVGMVDAQVRANVVSGQGADLLGPVSSYARSIESMSGPMGEFTLFLDVGVYDVRIAPPPGSNFPWQVVPDVAIGGGDVPLRDVYELENPVTLTGEVAFDVDGAPVPVSSGTIRAWAILGEGDAQRAVLVGESTIEAGSYALLLPPSI